MSGPAAAVVLVVALVSVGACIGLLVSERTRRQQAIRALEEANERHDDALVALRAEMAARWREVDRAEDLEFRDSQRTALLRSVSHDLRTPLSAIRAVATDLLDGVHYDDATRIELLETVCDEVDRLDRLVANLLSMSRIEAGAFTPERQAVDLDELVTDRLRQLQPLLRHVTAKTRVPDDLPLIHGDYAQLEQVLTNLLANAARHAPRDSDVWVVAKALGADQVQVEVSDQGKGIPGELHEHVFEPFRRGEGSQSTGVGLTICRAIVEAHGGRIWIERTFGGGATLAFTLPALPAAPAPPAG